MEWTQGSELRWRKTDLVSQKTKVRMSKRMLKKKKTSKKENIIDCHLYLECN